MSRVCNIHKACKRCGAPVKANVRFCTTCAEKRRAERARGTCAADDFRANTNN